MVIYDYSMNGGEPKRVELMPADVMLLSKLVVGHYVKNPPNQPWGGTICNVRVRSDGSWLFEAYDASNTFEVKPLGGPW